MVASSGKQNTESAAFRAVLRREKIAARDAMSPQEHALACSRITEELWAWLMPRKPGCIGFCWAVRKEFDCRPLVVRLLDIGWRACQPVVVKRAAPMEFREWQPDSPMAKDMHDIPIPATTKVPAPGVLLLPLVAFDKHGFRLGYGGGYFDRTLAELDPRPITIGVGFELGRLDSIRPTSHDIAMDIVFTEKGRRQFTAA